MSIAENTSIDVPQSVERSLMDIARILTTQNTLIQELMEEVQIHNRFMSDMVDKLRDIDNGIEILDK